MSQTTDPTQEQATSPTSPDEARATIPTPADLPAPTAPDPASLGEPAAPASGRSVDAVLFDLGQVVVRWDPFRAFEGRWTRGEVQEFFDEIDFPTFNWAQDAGRPWAEARADLERTFPHRLEFFDAYRAHVGDTVIGPVPGTAEVIRELAAAGIRVLGLSNWSAEDFHHAAPAAPVIAELEDVVVSGQVGMAKPDPAIFDLTVRRFALDPGRTLFVDDMPRNLAVAADRGLRVHRFVDASTLRAELVALGALPSGA